MWTSSQLNVMPRVGAAKEKNANTMTSGVLRTTVTYVAPAVRSTAIGPTRIATRNVPRTIDRTPDARKSANV